MVGLYQHGFSRNGMGGLNWIDVALDRGVGGPSAFFMCIDPLKPNDLYMRRIAPLTSRICILNIYSTNIRTEYFKYAA